VLAIVAAPASSRAATPCDGPAACCSAPSHSERPGSVSVSLGLAIEGIHNLDERNGTWDLDFYLYEKWPATFGFTPQTEIVNELIRQDAPTFDLIEFRDGYCERSRRLHSTLRVDYDLRRFPFDHQDLVILLSDADYDGNHLRYADRPLVADADGRVLSQVSGWHVSAAVAYRHGLRKFTGEEGSPQYDYTRFSVTVDRRAIFHMTRYFIPLFLIVVVGFCIFWIEPEDLNTQVSIGVTCLLAMIALQYAESSNLPAVAYLTLADRIYATCYFVIVTILIETVYVHSAIRRGNSSGARRVRRRSRVLFPSILILAVAISVMLSFRT